MGLGSSSWSWDLADPIPMLPPHGLSRDEGNGPCPAPQIPGKAETTGIWDYHPLPWGTQGLGALIHGFF